MAKKQVIKKDITEMVFMEATRELTNAGFEYIEQLGVRSNNGCVFAYEGDYIEIWDNTDMKTPNIAIRPKKSTAEGLPLKTWERELRGEVTVTSPKGNTIRIKCVTMHAVAVVLFRCIAEIQKIEKRAERARKQVAEKKQAVVKKEAETAVSVA